MDLDPTRVSVQEDVSYSDYDNRPIRPMNQEALNETLARLPILIDEEDYNNRTNASTESNTSIKARLTNRRQPNLAYSTRRKNLPVSSSTVTSTSESLLQVNTTIGTPKNNKRKLGGCTPSVTPSAHKVIKQLDCRQELIQLKEEMKLLEEAKSNLQMESVLLANAHEVELENLRGEHQHTIDCLVEEHRLQCKQFEVSLNEKEHSVAQKNVELDNVRNDQKLLLLEKETLDQVLAEYQVSKEEMTNKLKESESIIRTLREQVENLTRLQQQQQKQSTGKSSLSNGRMILKGSTTDRPRPTGSVLPSDSKSESNRTKINVKTSISRGTKKNELLSPASSSVNTSLNKSNSSTCSSVSTLKPPPSKTKSKPQISLDEQKKCLSSIPSVDKRTSLISTRTRSKVIPIKS